MKTAVEKKQAAKKLFWNIFWDFVIIALAVVLVMELRQPLPQSSIGSFITAPRIKTDEQLYDSMLEHIENYETDFYVRNVSSGCNGEAVLKRIFMEHPELFWPDGKASLKSGHYFNGLRVDYEICLSCGIDCSREELEEMSQRLDRAAEEIAAEASGLGSQRDKALYVHNRIIESCQYDRQSYDPAEGSHGGDFLSFNAYGCLINGKALCGGYTRAYQLVLSKLGIECGYVYGTASYDGFQGEHGWNWVRLDGEYSMVDLTWDDPVGYSGEPLSDWFCLTKEEMAKTHFADPECEIPW